MSPGGLREIQGALAAAPLHPAVAQGAVPWIVAEPFHLDGELWRALERIGEELRRFLGGCLALLREPAVAQRLRGTLSDAERAGVARLGETSCFPLLVRPDLVLDLDGNLFVTEIDLHPAHAGVLQRMQEVFGQGPTVAEVWATHVGEPAVVSVPGWKPFCGEQGYFAERVRAHGGRLDFVPIEDWQGLAAYGGVLFKNCCTIDLLSASYPAFVPPKAVLCPPVLLDWKGWLALPGEIAGLAGYAAARRLPEAHLLPLDPRRERETRRELLDLPRREKGRWIVKPLTSWGGRGFREGEHLSADEWNRLVLGLSPAGPRHLLLQRKIESRRFSAAGLTEEGEAVELEDLRIRLGPYYVMGCGRSHLAGALVTLRRSDKVRGARDAIYTLGLPDLAKAEGPRGREGAP